LQERLQKDFLSFLQKHDCRNSLSREKNTPTLEWIYCTCRSRFWRKFTQDFGDTTNKTSKTHNLFIRYPKNTYSVQCIGILLRMGTRPTKKNSQSFYYSNQCQQLKLTVLKKTTLVTTCFSKSSRKLNCENVSLICKREQKVPPEKIHLY
jgi:hypothetical protein